MSKYFKNFNNISIADIPVVGGKNASLGEMFSKLYNKGINVPNGFATTTLSFSEFISLNNLSEPISDLLSQLDHASFLNLSTIAGKIRQLILNGNFSDDFTTDIFSAYKDLCNSKPLLVAVRSSATAEDLPNLSFAGLHDSFLNVDGYDSLIDCIKKCYASLYTDRAIKYREDNSVDHIHVLLSVGIQIMVRSDIGSSGLAFTLEPETGFRDIIHLSAANGVGENIVQGLINPDEYLVFKPTLLLNKSPILKKSHGYTFAKIDKSIKATKSEIINFVLADSDIITLSKWSCIIEDHYQKPMDIEWAKDGNNGNIYILQARPETVHSQKNNFIQKIYSLSESGEKILQGQAVGRKVVSGKVLVLDSLIGFNREIAADEIIVTTNTSPDWDPILKNALAIITEVGGRTSHASIVARELGVPAIVGCTDAKSILKTGDQITVSCCEGSTGYIYRGIIKYTYKEIDFSKVEKPKKTDVMLIIADPEKAYQLSYYPNDGVGLLRIEFIINHTIQVHPMALIHFDDLTSEVDRKLIENITFGYNNKRDFFVKKMTEGIAVIASAFYPKDVIVRFSDFKTNEYANLIGGKQYEPAEENPMLGFRGASRYYNELYQEAFSLECKAIKILRDELGFTNVKVMIPFCRSIEEAKKVFAVMAKSGLVKGINDLSVYVMAELPANVLLADEFAKLFDGFSIGSNDLTQLILGIDRDSSLLESLFDEQNAAVKKMITEMIRMAHFNGKSIGLCGQGPSDFPEYAKFLVHAGIDSISFNEDSLLKGIENIIAAEAEMAKNSLA